MPGPLSAPNGDAQLTKMTGERRVRLAEQRKLNTGKTKKKRENEMNTSGGQPFMS